MKTPNIFFSRTLAAAAVLAVSAVALPVTSNARDNDHHDRGWGWGHDRHHDRGHPVYYSRHRSVGASVQRALAVRGYYHGPADGDIGPGTRRAIVRFQLEHGMRPTGEINSQLLRALRLD